MVIRPETRAEKLSSAGIGAALGALGEVPVVGGILAGIVGSFVPDVKVERVIRFAEDLAARVEAVEDKIDHEFVLREEFAAAVEDTLDRITRRRNDQKLQFFAAAIAATMTVDRPAERERERLVDLLDELRPSHLSVLAGIARGTPPPDARPPFTVGVAANDAVAAATASADTDDVQGDIRQLEVRGLIVPMGSGTVMLHAAYDVRRLVTPLGWKLIQFAALTKDIVGPPGSDEPEVS